MHKPLLTLLFIAAAFTALAQESTADEKKIGRLINEEITIDFKTGTITPTSLPFDVPFILKGSVPKEITKVRLKIIDKKFQCNTGDCINECLSCKDTESQALRALMVKYELATRPSIKAERERELQRLKVKVAKDTTTDTVLMLSRIKELQALDAAELKMLDDIRKKRAEIEEAAITEKANKKCSCGDGKALDCGKCSSIDFSKCHEVCPWEKSIFSEETANNETVNKFFLNIPPLKANENYQFFFSFERSVSGERATLDGLMIPILQQSLSSDIDNFKRIIFDDKAQLQKDLRDAIAKYYKDTNSINVDFSGELLSSLYLQDFQSLLEVEKAGPYHRTIEDLFSAQQGNLGTYEKDVPTAVRSWKNLVTGALVRDLLGNILRQTDLSAEETSIKSKFSEMTGTDVMLTNVVGGNSTITNFVPIKPDLEEVLSGSEVDAYSTNVMSTLGSWRELLQLIAQLDNSPELRRKIYLTDAEAKEFETLSANTSRNSTEEARFVLLRDRSLTDVQTLRKDVGDVITDLTAVYYDLLEHKRQLSQMDQYFQQVAAKSFQVLSLASTAPLTTTADFVTRTGYYITADAGFAYMFFGKLFPAEIQPYYGANFHLGPINRQSQYSIFRCGFRRNWYKSFSVITGITVKSLETTGGRRKNSLDNLSLLNGIGFRVLEPVRVSVGGVWVKVSDANPLIDRNKLHMYPYVAISLDLDVQKYIGKIADAFPK